MANIFLTYLGISVSVGIVVLAILLASPFINRRYAAKWKYFIWIFLAVRLLVPISGIYHKQTKSPAVASSVPSQTAAYSPAETQGGQVYEQTRRFVVEIPVEIPAGAAGQIISKPDEKSGGAAVSLFDIAFAAWLAGAVVFAAVPILSCLHYKRRIMRHGERIGEGSALEMMQLLKKELNIKQKVMLIRYSQAASPMIIGFIKPALVLPGNEFSDDELYFIIRHELIHLKRHDVYVKLLSVLANAVHWFNPMIWIMRKETSIDMELSCDEGVINGQDFSIKKAYTETLMSSLRRQSFKRSSLTTQFYGGKSTMKKRFSNILGKGSKKNGIAILICAVVLATFLGIMVGCTQKQSMPTDGELADLINGYLDFEAISTHENLPADFDNPPSDDPASEEHWIYPVTKEGMTTWEDWQNYLGGIFTESGVKLALEKTSSRYIKYNGNLYYTDGGMGWTLSDEYSIAKTVQKGANAFTVELWREYDPDFCESGEREFCITTLSFENTSNGWRIVDYSDRDATANDSNPNLAGYNPFGAPSNAAADNALTEEEMNRLINEYLRFEKYTVYDCVRFRSNDPESGVWIGDTFIPEIAVDGSYLPSDEEGLTTWQEWLDFIHGIFTNEEAEERLKELTGEGNRYINVDGDLYVLPVGGKGWYLDDPFQAAYKTDGDEGIIELWRESVDWQYCITVFSIKLTDSGWRVYAVNSYDTDFFTEGTEGYEPLLDKPITNIDNTIDTGIDAADDVLVLANQIYEYLEYYYRTTVYILNMHMTEPINLVEGVDQLGNLREIDGVTYVPMIEDYDTIDKIMEVFRRVYTEEKCDTLYSRYLDADNTGFMKEVDGKLYAMATGELGHTFFNVPITSAEQISETEILAKTTVTYDSGDVPYEITFKYEDEQWKIDKLVEFMSEEGRELSY